MLSYIFVELQDQSWIGCTPLADACFECISLHNCVKGLFICNFFETLLHYVQCFCYCNFLCYYSTALNTFDPTTFILLTGVKKTPRVSALNTPFAALSFNKQKMVCLREFYTKEIMKETRMITLKIVRGVPSTSSCRKNVII